MPYRYQMTNKNEYGDNGWWKKTGDTIAHYFFEKLPLCGTPKFHSPDMGVQQKTAYDRRCQRCTPIRRKQLIDRMKAGQPSYLEVVEYLLEPKSHSPRKPQ